MTALLTITTELAQAAAGVIGSVLAASGTPTPDPTYIAPNVDPNRVTPGLLGFLSFMFLILACVVLFFSLRKQLSRINFDPDALPGGVRPVPRYARTDAPVRTTPSSARTAPAGKDAQQEDEQAPPAPESSDE